MFWFDVRRGHRSGGCCCDVCCVCPGSCRVHHLHLPLERIVCGCLCGIGTWLDASLLVEQVWEEEHRHGSSVTAVLIARVQRHDGRRGAVQVLNRVANEDEVAHASRVLREPHCELDQVVTPASEHGPPDVAVAERATELSAHGVLLGGVKVMFLRLALNDLVDGVVLAAHHELAAVVGERRDEEDADDSALQHEHTVT